MIRVSSLIRSTRPPLPIVVGGLYAAISTLRVTNLMDTLSSAIHEVS